MIRKMNDNERNLSISVKKRACPSSHHGHVTIIVMFCCYGPFPFCASTLAVHLLTRSPVPSAITAADAPPLTVAWATVNNGTSRLQKRRSRIKTAPDVLQKDGGGRLQKSDLVCSARRCSGPKKIACRIIQ